MSQANSRSFGKYRLLQRLAMGGMAEIFRAQLVGAAGFARDLVIKRIHPEFSDDAEFVRMFINEARLAAMLRHPNVVQVLDFDQIDGTYYIAMELIDGLDLKLLRLRGEQHDQPLPQSLAVYIVAETLRGLAYAHEFSREGQRLHIVHRDISPQNIMVSCQGEVKVTDFGIARVVEQISLTGHGVLKGKMSYMAPEQTHSSQVDARADLFSVGVVLWELLCKKRLFQAPSPVALLHKVRHHPIPPPHTQCPGIDSELSELVMWALARDPDARIPNAPTFVQHLQPWLDSPSLQEDLRRYVRARMELPEPGRADASSSPRPARRKQTARLEGWRPPSASEAATGPVAPSPEKRTSGLPVEGEDEGRFVSAPTLAPAPDTYEDEPVGASWDSFPSLSSVTAEQPAASPGAGRNEWLIKTDQIEPAALLVAAEEDASVLSAETLSVEETIQLEPALLLTSHNAQTDRDKEAAPAEASASLAEGESDNADKSAVLSTVLLEPGLLRKVMTEAALGAAGASKSSEEDETESNARGATWEQKEKGE